MKRSHLLVGVFAVTAGILVLLLFVNMPKPWALTRTEHVKLDEPRQLPPTDAVSERERVVHSNPAPTPEPQAVTSELTFEVHTVHDQRPLPGASITALWSDGETEPLGTTGSAGELALVMDEDPLVNERYLSVMVKHDGFASRLYNVGYQRAERVLIGLTPEGQIRGIVSDVEGNPVEGAEVVAFPTSHPIRSPAGVERLRRGLHSGAVARTDPGGGFLLTGLAEGGKHVLAAGHGGCFSQSVGAIAGQGDVVTLVTRNLVGAFVEIRMRDGSALPNVTPSESMGIGLWTDWRGAPAEPLPIDFLEQPFVPPFQFGLIDLPHEEVFASCWPRIPGVFLVVGLATHSLPEESPAVTFKVRLPRIPPMEIPTRLETWGPGFPTRVVSLTQEPYATGTLVVTLQAQGPGVVVPDCAVSVDTVMLLLTLKEVGGSASLAYSFTDLSRPARIQVPAGRYSVEARPNAATDTRWRMVNGDRYVDVAAGAEAAMTLEARDLGALSFDVRRSSGEALDGRLSLFLGRADERSGKDWVSFRRPPYCLPRVLAGTYVVHKVMSPRTRDFTVVPSSFRVDAGRHSTVELILPVD